MPTTYDTLHGRLVTAFDAVVPGADPVLRPSERVDYQANGVMAVAKGLGRPPRDVAADIIAHLDLEGIAEVEVAGPGFLNITLTTEFLSRQLGDVVSDPRAGIATASRARNIVIDYSAPNVAKEMHVGHLRSTVIGDSLARLYRFLGDNVVPRNHIGDWGTPFGMLIEHLIDLGEDAAVLSLSMGDLDSFYRAARAKFDADDSFKERSRHRVVLLQSGDDETNRLWRVLVDQSVAYFQEVYDKLDVTMTPRDVVGESFYNDRLDAVVRDLDTAGLLVDSDGAKCVFPDGFENRDGEPLPLIVQKSDEGFGYAATDLAAVRHRVSELHADEILYVVGAPQAQHFAMVFSTARSAGWLPPTVRCEHIAFGNVLGSDRKMFKTRSGETVKLISLIDEAADRALAALVSRNPDMPDAERHALALDLARAALKYADLSNERQKDYVFDLDRMVAFEGDTGPYLCYAHARIRSILRRVDDDLAFTAMNFEFAEPAARSLALGVLGFPEALDATINTTQPHRLCTYLFDLAQRFTAFYEACPVVASEGDVRRERLALCVATSRVLEIGLSLLGIRAPERM
jgi:arginyl-tRNA synthetase